MIGASLLLISLFITWYDDSGDPARDRPTQLAATPGRCSRHCDLVLAGTAIVAIYAAYEQVDRTRPDPGSLDAAARTPRAS